MWEDGAAFPRVREIRHAVAEAGLALTAATITASTSATEDSPATSPLTPPTSTASQQRASSAGPRRTCRVPGCTEALEPGYCKNYRICRPHSRADSFLTEDGKYGRHCQQCGRTHALEEFDLRRHSCRKSLAQHQRARLLRQMREIQPDPAPQALTQQQAQQQQRQRQVSVPQLGQKRRHDEPAAQQQPTLWWHPVLGLVVLPQVLLLDEHQQQQPTTPRTSLQLALPLAMKDSVVLPSPVTAAEQPGMVMRQAPPLAPVCSSEEQLPPVLSDFPALFCPVEDSPSPRPDLVRRAMRLLEDPLLECQDMPSIDELLSFNEQLGLQLRAGDAPGGGAQQLLPPLEPSQQAQHQVAAHEAKRPCLLARTPSLPVLAAPGSPGTHIQLGRALPTPPSNHPSRGYSGASTAMQAASATGVAAMELKLLVSMAAAESALLMGLVPQQLPVRLAAGTSYSPGAVAVATAAAMAPGHVSAATVAPATPTYVVPCVDGVRAALPTCSCCSPAPARDFQCGI